MSTREPVFVDGEFIGWNVKAESEFETIRDVTGTVIERVCIRQGGTLFVPVNETERGY